MKRICLAIFFMLICPLAFCYTFDELKKYPYEQTSFYGGSFSYGLLDKVRVLEGNAIKTSINTIIICLTIIMNIKIMFLPKMKNLFSPNIFLIFQKNSKAVF